MVPFRWIFASLLLFVAAACGSNPSTSDDGGVPDSGTSIDPGPPSCTDGIRNGDEGDVDCGGSCATKCDNGQRCYANTDCGGELCSDGVCVECITAAQCPGSDTECTVRTCVANQCGTSNVAAGAPSLSQTQGDCQVRTCDGNGTASNVADNTDVPADDGNQCTAESCKAGVPSHAKLPVDTACHQNGGAVCDANASCVACNTADQCPGSDSECAVRTCVAGACGFSYTAAGTALTAQTSNDCQANQCDGSGNVVSVADDADLPADDGNDCTVETCTAGVPSNPSAPADTACNQNGGAVCDGSGACVQCNVASQCPGADSDCQARTCSLNVCGIEFASAGTPVTTQTAGDCEQSQCDGSGNEVSVADDTDLPTDDGNDCTDEVCSNGAPTHPALAAGTSCGGGTNICDGSGSCMSAPTVTSITPADGASWMGPPTISVTFSAAMDPATLTGQTASGACSGSIQVSDDDFASCVAFGSASAALSSGDTVATLTPVPGLLVNHTYKVKVTIDAQSAAGVAMTSEYTQPAGFGFSYAGSSAGVVVISQVYGGGGNSGAQYKNDFVELHNRGGDTVSLTGMSVQYASTSGTTWSVAALSGTIPAGGYYLVQLAGGATGASLPVPDATSNGINLAGANGKVALVSGTTALTGACPTASVIDFIGYGTANCSEGSAAPAGSNSTALVRASGCVDHNVNATDFSSAAPAPRNSSTPVAQCVLPALNESDVPLEADYCTVQFPLSLTVQTGAVTPTIYGQLYEAGLTEATGADPSVVAQLGFGPATSNPQYEAGWTWIDASYNTQVTDNDEYQATFTAPAAGTWLYAYRFSLDGGASWTWCGTSGAGSNPGLTFTLDSLGVMTVTP